MTAFHAVRPVFARSDLSFALSGGSMRALMFSFALVSLAAHFPAQAQTAPLNDTGVTQCVSGGGLDLCTNANTGDTAPLPRQDARFGRDAAAGKSQLSKTGGGAAGFDFTPLAPNGTAIGLIDGMPSHTPTCVHDNVTDLTWEVKTAANMNTTYTWAAATTYAGTVNVAGLCGSNLLWRVPTRRELLSIVHYGTNNPAIDTNYFPNTVCIVYWTSDVDAADPANNAWVVSFSVGNTVADTQTFNQCVRLVRSGP
jgi:hypothetical protein